MFGKAMWSDSSLKGTFKNSAKLSLERDILSTIMLWAVNPNEPSTRHAALQEAFAEPLGLRLQTRVEITEPSWAWEDRRHYGPMANDWVY